MMDDDEDEKRRVEEIVLDHAAKHNMISVLQEFVKRKGMVCFKEVHLNPIRLFLAVLLVIVSNDDVKQFRRAIRILKLISKKAAEKQGSQVQPYRCAKILLELKRRIVLGKMADCENSTAAYAVIDKYFPSSELVNATQGCNSPAPRQWLYDPIRRKLLDAVGRESGTLLTVTEREKSEVLERVKGYVTEINNLLPPTKVEQLSSCNDSVPLEGSESLYDTQSPVEGFYGKLMLISIIGMPTEGEILDLLKNMWATETEEHDDGEKKKAKQTVRGKSRMEKEMEEEDKEENEEEDEDEDVSHRNLREDCEFGIRATHEKVRGDREAEQKTAQMETEIEEEEEVVLQGEESQENRLKSCGDQAGTEKGQDDVKKRIQDDRKKECRQTLIKEEAESGDGEDPDDRDEIQMDVDSDESDFFLRVPGQACNNNKRLTDESDEGSLTNQEIDAYADGVNISQTWSSPVGCESTLYQMLIHPKCSVVLRKCKPWGVAKKKRLTANGGLPSIFRRKVQRRQGTTTRLWIPGEGTVRLRQTLPSSGLFI